jgi:hypothetical protein
MAHLGGQAQNVIQIKNLGPVTESRAQNLHACRRSALKHIPLQAIEAHLEFQVIKKIISTAAAVVGIAGLGNVHAYQVTFGQDLNPNPTVPLSSLVFSTEARDRFAGGPIETQGFEGLPIGPGPLSLNFGSGETAVRATLTGGSGELVSNPTGLSEGRFSVAPSGPMGTKYWSVSANGEGSTFELWFNNPVVKFGFFGVDLFDFGGLLELEILGRDASGAVTVLGTVGPGDDPDADPPVTVGLPANGSVSYMGVTAESEAQYFLGVRFRAFLSPTSPSSLRSAGTDEFAFDSFTVVAAPRTPGTPVSAPGTLALLGTALLALGLLRRRAA